MKKLLLLFVAILTLNSCLNTDDLPNYEYEYIPIDEASTPVSFTLGQRDTIHLKYTFPSNCYNFDNIYYEYEGTSRTVAVIAYKDLDITCDEIPVEQEFDLVVNVSQRDDYLFKFYKGTDSDGKSIFEEVLIPVN
ncbi:hypothetical protein [Polaribacter sp.]|uniref:hypothetical protein n=1 Tax=Polaribacter sp. TaxID=1920175 RepID=UPI003F6CCBE4